MSVTCPGDPPPSISSRTSCDDLSTEECERLVLSPPPVPMNLDAACAAINEAARRTSSSRTHSINTQSQDGWGDNCNNPSCQDLSKLHLEKIPTKRPGFTSSSRWFRFLCCFSTHNIPTLQHVASKKAQDGKADPIINHVHASPSSTMEWNTRRRNRLKFWPLKKTLRITEVDTSRQSPTTYADIQQHRLPETSHTISGTEIDHSTTSPLPYRPVLPSSVLSALTSCHSTVSSSNTVTDPLTSSNGTSSIPSVPAAIRKNAFSTTSSLSSSFSSHPLDVGRADRDPSSSTDASDTNTATSTQVQPTSRINHVKLFWDSGDRVDHAPLTTTVDPHGSDADLNGAQGDTSLENLERMTPGMDLLGDVPADCINKKCLVLDLDETLVHSWFKYVDNASFVVPVDLDGVKHQIYVCKRPHLDEFLRAVAPLFECVMFTASLRKYADPVCDHIDDEGSCFRHRLFREACVYHQNNLIKDLSRLGRDIDQVCIVDNSPVSFLFQPNNALQVVSWFDDPNDQALLELIPYLRGLAQSNTVVEYLREFQPPASAAVAQPPTPSWFFLFDSTASHELDENDVITESLDDTTHEYCAEEEAVLSPHFHPPVPLHSNTTSALIRSYLTQLEPQSHARVIQQRMPSMPVSTNTVNVKNSQV